MPDPYFESERNVKLSGTQDANGVWTPNVASTGGGGGGPATIADGADVAQGTTTDVAYVSGSGTVIAILKGIFGQLAGTLTTAISGSVAVTGTFFQATQPVSIAAAPLPPASVVYTHSTVSVGIASGTLLAANASAKSRMFYNASSTATVWLADNVTAVVNTQIELLPKSSYEMSLMMGNLSTRAFNAIASAAATSVLVTEGQ